ncbi:MAG: endo-1,4-beta-xylanase [Spirochaetales bacterium]|nr:endo-1,4-beta-xylanase [Spirochaetales bacterium]
MSLKKARKALVIAVLLLFTPGLICAQSIESLKELGAKAGKSIGFEIMNNYNTLYQAETYQEIARREFNILMPDQATHIDCLQPSQGNFNWQQTDRLLMFARQNNLKVHGQNLTYQPASPSWLYNIRNRDLLISAMYKHIDTVLRYFKTKIFAWNVIDEAFNEDGSLRANFLLNTIGPDYFDLFFQRAREADPELILIYDDYNIEEIGPKSNGVYRMIKSMVERDIPIDAVGIQMHLTEKGIDYESFARNMSRFADLGLEIWITEMDVRINPMPSITELENQAEIYRQIVTKVMAEPACKVLQFCGITDRYSWVPSTFPETGAPLLWDDEYEPKPAYYAVHDVLAKGPIEPTPSPLPPDMEFEFIPDEVNTETFSTAQLNLSLTSQHAVLGAYELNIHYDPHYLKPNTEKGVFQPGSEGFFTAATAISNKVIQAAGFDASGIGPGSEMDFLKINFTTRDNSGITEITATVNNLHDQLSKPLTGKIGYATLFIHYVKQCPLLGDGNKDGAVNIIDALLAAQIYVGIQVQNATEPCLDVDCDGKVTIVDALLIAQYYVAASSEGFSCQD